MAQAADRHRSTQGFQQTEEERERHGREAGAAGPISLKQGVKNQTQIVLSVWTKAVGGPPQCTRHTYFLSLASGLSVLMAALKRGVCGCGLGLHARFSPSLSRLDTSPGHCL